MSGLRRIRDWYCASSAIVAGDVHIGAGSSIWFGSVLRGDDAAIRLGERVNVQDNSVLHADPGVDLVIEDDVTIGHMAMVHGVRIGAGSLIGIGSVILDGVEVGEGCLIGARALLTPGQKVPPGSVVLGAPGKIVRQTTSEERARFLEQAQRYAWKAERWLAGDYPSVEDHA